MICDLFKDNLNLFGALTSTEYEYFIDLIRYNMMIVCYIGYTDSMVNSLSSMM